MSTTEHPGQLEVADMADHLLSMLEQLEHDHPCFLRSTRPEYISLKNRVIAEQNNPAPEESTLRGIYEELQLNLKDAAADLENVSSMQSGSYRQLIPELYIRENFNLMAAIFKSRQREVDESEIYTRMAENAVMGKTPDAIKDVPRELRSGFKRKILKVLTYDENSKEEIEADIREFYRRFGFEKLKDFFAGNDAALNFLLELVDESGREREPVHHVIAIILAARNEIRSRVNPGRGHLRLV